MCIQYIFIHVYIYSWHHHRLSYHGYHHLQHHHQYLTWYLRRSNHYRQHPWPPLLPQPPLVIMGPCCHHKLGSANNPSFVAAKTWPPRPRPRLLQQDLSHRRHTIIGTTSTTTTGGLPKLQLQQQPRLQPPRPWLSGSNDLGCRRHGLGCSG